MGRLGASQYYALYYLLKQKLSMNSKIFEGKCSHFNAIILCRKRLLETCPNVFKNKSREGFFLSEVTTEDKKTIMVQKVAKLGAQCCGRVLTLQCC